MTTLDFSSPYSEVFGVEGARFLQDGRLFRGNGREVGDNSIEPILDDKREPSDPSQMHWRSLKVLVESFGGTFTNKADAIKFLGGANGLDS